MQSSTNAPAQSEATTYNGKVFPEYTFDFNDISVVNRDAVPPTANAVSFPDNKSFLQVYEEFLRLSGKQFGSLPPSITYEEFVNLYGIICFDLSRIDEDKVFNSMSKAHLDIDFTPVESNPGSKDPNTEPIKGNTQPPCFEM